MGVLSVEQFDILAWGNSRDATYRFDQENAPIRFVFELSKGGWKFAGLDNINE
jgi:hypothetical protein